MTAQNNSNNQLVLTGFRIGRRFCRVLFFLLFPLGPAGMVYFGLIDVTPSIVWICAITTGVAGALVGLLWFLARKLNQVEGFYLLVRRWIYANTFLVPPVTIGASLWYDIPLLPHLLWFVLGTAAIGGIFTTLILTDVMPLTPPETDENSTPDSPSR